LQLAYQSCKSLRFFLQILQFVLQAILILANLAQHLGLESPRPTGIFAFGLLFVRDTPWLVELGVLLDVFVGVFVMGVTIFNINQAFDHIETDRLVRLQDMTPGDIEETEEAPR